jgi:hypothetical protein
MGVLGHRFRKKIYKPKRGEVKTEWWKLLFWETSWLKFLVRNFSHDHKKKCDKRDNITTCLKLINSCFHNLASVWYSSYSQPGVHVTQGYEPGHLGVREKKWRMAEKGTYVNSVRQDKSQSCEINWTLWRVAGLKWRVQFMEIGCQEVRKGKNVGNHCGRG